MCSSWSSSTCRRRFLQKFGYAGAARRPPGERGETVFGVGIRSSVSHLLLISSGGRRRCGREHGGGEDLLSGADSCRPDRERVLISSRNRAGLTSSFAAFRFGGRGGDVVGGRHVSLAHRLKQREWRSTNGGASVAQRDHAGQYVAVRRAIRRPLRFDLRWIIESCLPPFFDHVSFYFFRQRFFRRRVKCRYRS